ncbi:TonB-dependent receptor domain-containing protein [Parasphingorhabdus sp.]|uniref:TonB-dependent receptor domain-containing protein n=1 Tax=Parasphingorhabdus sp. TaxID=2709688 RepID=UPI003A8F83E8
MTSPVATFSAAFFYTDVDDFQETSFSGASFDTINSQVNVIGAEASLFWKLSDNFTLDTAWTYADATIDAGTFLIGGVPTAFPDRSPAQSPKWTGHFGMLTDWQLTDDWDFTGSAYFRHRSSMIHQFVETFRSDSLSTLDITIGVANPANGLAFSIIGTNLTNEISADFSGPPASAGIVPPDVRADSPGRFRTVLLQARLNF